MAKPANVYTMSHLYLDKTSPVSINGVGRCSLNPAVEALLLESDGEVHPRYSGVAAVRPVIAFDTYSVAKLLALGTNTFALYGQAISSSCIAKTWLQKLTKGAGRAGAGANVLMAVNEGILVPRRLAASGARPAVLSCEIVATWDGTNAPITLTGSQSLVGDAGADAALFVGPVSVNGTALEGVQSITVDFGISLVLLGEEEDATPQYVAVGTGRPSIRVAFANADFLTTLGVWGNPQGATDTLVYLRAGTKGGARVAKATAAHTKISVDDGVIYAEGLDEGGGIQVPTLVIQPTYDGTNAILVVDTASAIA